LCQFSRLQKQEATIPALMMKIVSFTLEDHPQNLIKQTYSAWICMVSDRLAMDIICQGLQCAIRKLGLSRWVNFHQQPASWTIPGKLGGISITKTIGLKKMTGICMKKSAL